MLHGSTPRPNKPIISSQPNKMDIDWQGNKVPGGVELWAVGTDTAKDWLTNRMHLSEGPGILFDQMPPEWFDQMVVEQPRTVYRKGRAKVTDQAQRRAK